MRSPGRSLRAAAGLLAAAVLGAGCGPVVAVEPVASVALAPVAQTSRVLAGDGSVLAELHGEQDRVVVPLTVVPAIVRDAVVATEDARFYEHGGVDARSVARALAANARDGRVRQGGSTITQQLAKNAVVGDERSMRRKLSEAGIALSLERSLSKDEILERYLNTVYFGNGAYGIQTAARRYFGTDVGALSVPQAALLAGLLKAPRDYDPFRHPDAARRRRDFVLRRMRTAGVLSPRKQRRAQSEELGVVGAPHDPGWRAPWFVDHVLDVLQHDRAFAALGDDPVARADSLFRGGVRIETTLDPVWQEAAEDALAATLTSPRDPSGAIVAIDPATGGVGALVGGRLTERGLPSPTDDFSRFNLATDGRRQPGSTFKQVVLATALQQGHVLDETFDASARVVIPPRPGEPHPYPVRNYDRRDYGRLTLREATAASVNVVFAQLLAEVGPEAVVATAEALGVTAPLEPLRSLALGAQEVTVLDMASVQATLAAGGLHRPVSVVTRVTGADGEVLYSRPPPEATRVLDEAVAWLTTEALRGVVTGGTGQRADLRRPMAGKTGTTQRGADAWFAGYTPDFAAAVWLGFPEGAVPMEPPRTRIPVEGGNWPAEIFARMGLRALQDVPASDFPRPDVNLITVRVDASRNCLPNPYTPRQLLRRRSYVRGTEPTGVCQEPTGPAAATVPGVTGLPLETAQRLLEGAGLAVRRRSEASATLPPGYVTRQDPAPDAAAGSDTTVTLWVATSDRVTEAVPDVEGADAIEATLLLEQAGFAVRVEDRCPQGSGGCDDGFPGEVWRQRPEGGDEVARHSVVRLRAYPSK